MAMTFNDKQKEAIHARNENVLIAAGAGSGKSTVLVERLMRKMLNKTDAAAIDEFLIVTFTNLAAQEMLTKIRKALNEALKAGQSEFGELYDTHHLNTQIYQLSYAHISTFHGFCMAMIQRYYYLLDLDANVSIMDERESQLLLSEILDDFMIDMYEEEEFQFLSDVFAADRNDNKLKTILVDIYKMAIQKPDMYHWLHHLGNMYHITGEKIDDWFYYDHIKNIVQTSLDAAENHVIDALKFAKKSSSTHGYIDMYEQDVSMINSLRQMLETGSYNDVRHLLQHTQLLPFPRKKKGLDEVESEAHEYAKNMRTKYVKLLFGDGKTEGIKQKFYAYTHESHKVHFAHGARVAKSLAYYITKLDDIFLAAKKKASKVDFSDLERLMLEMILANPDVLCEIADGFVEIMIDEYQDTNPMQEEIIRLLSTKGRKHIPVFMVGDVKQSIYRFRGAEPTIFRDKYDGFEYGKENSVTEPANRKIDLMDNYRSSRHVISATNYLFDLIMRKDVATIEYDDAARLKCGKMGDDNEKFNKPELYVINSEMINEANYDENQTENPENIELEAHFLAQKMRQMVEEKQEVWDSKLKANRVVTYSDMVVLLRTMVPSAHIYRILKLYKIPVSIETTGSLLEEIEVGVLSAALEVIDNPYQDIPLAAVMKSPLFFFTERELAQIVIHKKGKTFYEAVKSYEQAGDDTLLKAKITTFLGKLNHWRYLEKSASLSQLMEQICEETGYYYFVLGQKEGESRRAQLDLFIENAAAYEKNTLKGLYGFLRYLAYLKKQDITLPAAQLPSTEAGVKIMTIHKSKGLEFPVVFLANLTRKFNTQDEKGDCLLHKQDGLGIRYIDPLIRLKQKTLPERLIVHNMHQEMLAEEMRLLYVALTRSESKLIASGVMKTKKSIEEKMATDIKPAFVRAAANSFMDWMLPAVSRDGKENPWELTVVDNLDLEAFKTIKSLINLKAKTNTLDEHAIEKQLLRVYSLEELSQMTSKQSVTQRKIAEDLPAYKGIPEKFEAPVYDRPSFVKTDVLATELGTGLHQFMQHLEVSEGYTLAALEARRSELVRDFIIDETVALKLDLPGILKFTQSALYQSLIMSAKNGKIQKELPFTMLFQDGIHDQSLAMLQGVIDLLAEVNDEIWIVDYKTDKIVNFTGQKAELRKRYLIQMKYYLQAVRDIYPHVASEKIVAKVYFMHAADHLTYSLKDFE